ncbi:MAG: dihydrofolate reductase family protein [Bacteroidales bacterium]|jgi:2,5-diamino-6-(ribosylamino)-4(3H)-pyrimidinone 5'-phosphate reductase
MKVILHNSISLDGSFTGIAANMELHYQAVNSFGAQVYMVGSNTTSRASIEQNGEIVPPETASDFHKPVRDPALPYWVIPDTKGTLQGILHYYRQFEYCRDVILLVSETTPAGYIDYLEKRDYDYIKTGSIHADYREAFRQLALRYGIDTILVDTGSRLGNVLLNEGLIDEISLVFTPEILAKATRHIFEGVEKNIKLRCQKCEKLPDDYIWTVYEIIKPCL